MKLHIKAVAAALNITPDTVDRWIRQGRIPMRKKGDDCLFSQSALQKWAASNNMSYSLPGTGSHAPRQEPLDTLGTAMAHGGIFYDVGGESVPEVLRAGVDRINCFSTAGQRETLYESLLAREALMSTGIGKGVAIPHPRTPLDHGDIPAFITTCFLEKPVEYKAVDRQPIFVLFFLVCPSSKLHLHLLARLSFCLRDAVFIEFLTQKPDPSLFLEKIAEQDQRFTF